MPQRRRASFRFYAELNDHLGPGDRFRTLEKEFYVPTPAKDMIEGLGVPHTEVELILVNGETVDFTHPIHNGDRVAVYPMFESVDVGPLLRVRARALRRPAFALDVHLGRLAGYLRMLGFDAAYANSASDAELATLASEQNRILLTRDRGVLKRAAVTRGYWLRETGSRQQVEEVGGVST